MSNIKMPRGPRPAMPAWANDEAIAKVSAFIDYLEQVVVKVSPREATKILSFVERASESFNEVEKAGEKKLKALEEKPWLGEENTGAKAALNAMIISSVDAVMASVMILTGIKPEA